MRTLSYDRLNNLSLKLVFKGADGNAVPAVFLKHLTDAFTFGSDAVSSDAIFLHKHSLNRLSASGSKFLVELKVAIGRSVSFNHNFGVFVVLEERSYHFNIGLLVSSDLGATNAIEDVANALEVVADFFYDFGFAVLASSELSSEGIGFSLSRSSGSGGCIKFATKFVDLCVEGIDFGAVEGLNALEVAKVIGNAGKNIESGVVDVVSGSGLGYVNIAHIPGDLGFEGDSKVFGNIEVEVKTNTGGEIVVVAIAGIIEVTPTGTSYGSDIKEATVAFVTTEKVEEVDATVSANIGVVNSGFAVVIAVPRRGVDAGQAFNAKSESRRNLLFDMKTKSATHATKESMTFKGSSGTTINTYRPIGAKVCGFQCLLGLSCHHACSSNSNKKHFFHLKLI